MRILVLCIAAALSLSAQAMVESGLGAARAATTTAPAAGIGKSIAGVLSNLDKTIKVADKAASSETIIVSKEAPAAPAKKYEPIKNAETGLDYDELIERFGPPSLEIAAEPGVKKLTYSGKEVTTRLEVKDGIVATIDTVKPQQQSAVFTLPK